MYVIVCVVLVVLSWVVAQSDERFDEDSDDEENVNAPIQVRLSQCGRTCACDTRVCICAEQG